MTQRRCLPCEEACLRCTGPTSLDCTQCSGGLYLEAGACRSSCSGGAVGVAGSDVEGRPDNRCLPCTDYCLTCAGSRNNCTACARGSSYFYLRTGGGGGRCVLDCGPGLYAEPFTQTCEPCSPDCTSCTGPTSRQCTSCAPGLFRYLMSCLTGCPPETYAHWTENRCAPCPPGCQTCDSVLRDASTREFDLRCLSCQAPAHFLDRSALRCLLTCPLGTHASTLLQTCEPCDPACTSCTGPLSRQCQSCTAPSYFLDVPRTACVRECPLGYYPDALSSLCRPCETSIGCKTCLDQTQ